MSLEVEAYEGELRHLRKLNSFIRHEILAEKLADNYFICGDNGVVDNNNLPKRLYICPAYGCDWFQVYERTNVTGR